MEIAMSNAQAFALIGLTFLATLAISIGIAKLVTKAKAAERPALDKLILLEFAALQRNVVDKAQAVQIATDDHAKALADLQALQQRIGSATFPSIVGGSLTATTVS
jgi:hypothetical protein